VNWSDNPWFPEVLDKERQSLAERDPEAYRNVWEGECRSAVEGAIYAKEVAALYESGRVRPVPYDPLLPVHTVWDLGWNDQTSIILVQRASEVRIVGYIEDSRRTLAEYVAQLKALPYVWGNDWLPHDGRAKDFKSGKSAEEILTALQRSPRIVENLDIESGIKAARLMFPRVYMDPSAERLLHCLKRYRRTINANTNEPGPPLHDAYSHGADAFRYLALAVDQMGNAPTIKDPYPSFRRAHG
jgi:phage terminase large subunit